MQVTLSVPEACVGDVIGDLNSRRGRPQGMEPAGAMTEIRAEVPMSEMLTYAPDLRSITQGQGDYTLEFLRYEELPGHLAQKVVQGAGAERAGACALGTRAPPGSAQLVWWSWPPARSSHHSQTSSARFANDGCSVASSRTFSSPLDADGSSASCARHALPTRAGCARPRSSRQPPPAAPPPGSRPVRAAPPGRPPDDPGGDLADSPGDRDEPYDFLAEGPGDGSTVPRARPPASLSHPSPRCRSPRAVAGSRTPTRHLLPPAGGRAVQPQRVPPPRRRSRPLARGSDGERPSRRASRQRRRRSSSPGSLLVPLQGRPQRSGARPKRSPKGPRWPSWPARSRPNAVADEAGQLALQPE